MKGFTTRPGLSRPWLFVVSAGCMLLVIRWISLQQSIPPSVVLTQNKTTTSNHVVSPTGALLKHDPLPDIRNTSLGFQRVFAIGFPGRTDKKDAMTMASSFTDFAIDWINAVSPDDIPDKALPASWEKPRDKPNELGCWRAHMNVMQRIVEQRLSSALIFEDDADWDVSLKAQLTEFALGARAIQNTTDTPFSPYGDDWDILWIGHCAAGPRGGERRFYVIPDDPTVRPPSHSSEFSSTLFMEPWKELGDSTRIVFEQMEGVCLNAYAVSYNGARKIMSALAMSPLNIAVDMAYLELCRGDKFPGFKCIAPYPRLVSNWFPEGPDLKNSDINAFSDNWHEASSNGLVYSTMLNIHRLLAGEETVQAQYPECPKQFIDPSEIEQVRGHLEILPLPDSELVAHREEYVQ